jgi:tripartite-type tricarboxylate transporter receptor subunit TctC
MKLPRRAFLHLVAGAATLATISRVASALDYPARPVLWIVGFAPAGGNDIVGSVAFGTAWSALRLSQRTPQKVD